MQQIRWTDGEDKSGLLTSWLHAVGRQNAIRAIGHVSVYERTVGLMERTAVRKRCASILLVAALDGPRFPAMLRRWFQHADVDSLLTLVLVCDAF